jgi:hypothetical protein
MITKDTQVVAFSPRMTLAQFQAILAAAGSPAAPEAARAYSAIVTQGLSPAFILAIFKHESNYGLEGFAAVNKSPGNTRSSMTGMGILVQTVKGPFIRYPNWFEGFRDLAWRIVKPDYVYAQEGRRTIEQIITRFAPASDGNDPIRYVSAVVESMNSWIGEASTMNDPSDNVTILPLAFDPSHGRDGADIRFVTWHRQQGRNSLYDEFKGRKPGNLADCTFELKENGIINRLLPDYVAPWTNGFWANNPNLKNPVIAQLFNETGGRGGTNPWTITVETAGFVTSPLTEAQLNGAAKIAAYCYFTFGIPCDRTHHVGHGEVGEHPYCPGNLFQFDEIIRRGNAIIAKGGTTILNTKPLAPFDPNPLKLSVGQGMLDRANAERLSLLTNEQFFIPDPNQPPGLTKRSFAWAKRDGNIFMIVAIQDQGQTGNLLPTWTTQVWDQVA